ncbi:MAG TPA: ABC transporter ATP-binding protein, partial [Sutterella sp.]|nr:ABC transporter ATP-binding protein [Sutterella sp.]
MPFLTLSEAELSWGDMPLLDRASLAIEPGERIGLIGRNGTGKSSLLQVLAGIEKLEEGELIVQDGLRAVYLEQEPALDLSLTLRDSLVTRGRLEAIDDERDRWERLAKLDEYLDRLSLDGSALAQTASGGERKKAALALALSLEPDLL